MSYEIGYRRPPASGQFQKGNSGNPKGRPKGSKNFLTLLDQELNQKVVVNENGRKKSLTRLQAMVKRLVTGALQGDQRALVTLLEVMRRTGKFDVQQGNAALPLLPDNYEQILEAYVQSRGSVTARPAHGKARSGGRS
jgi:hypothetical protein